MSSTITSIKTSTKRASKVPLKSLPCPVRLSFDFLKDSMFSVNSLYGHSVISVSNPVASISSRASFTMESSFSSTVSSAGAGSSFLNILFQPKDARKACNENQISISIMINLMSYKNISICSNKRKKKYIVYGRLITDTKKAFFRVFPVVLSK